MAGDKGEKSRRYNFLDTNSSRKCFKEEWSDLLYADKLRAESLSLHLATLNSLLTSVSAHSVKHWEQKSLWECVPI